MEFKDILKGKEEEGKEKHVPTIEILKGHGKEGNDLVRVIIGKEVPHPNTVEHHIVWTELYGIKESGQAVDLGRINFTPVYSSFETSFKINNIDEFKAFCALGYCNIHGVWQNCLEV